MFIKPTGIPRLQSPVLLILTQSLCETELKVSFDHIFFLSLGRNEAKCYSREDISKEEYNFQLNINKG